MATPAETADPLIPRDETAAILEQTFGGGDSISVDPEGEAGSVTGIGFNMCEKILESTTERTEEDHDTSAATEDYRGEPAAASTPLRTAMEKVRIVDIERTPRVAGIDLIASVSENEQQGEENSAREMDVSCVQGDAASASTADALSSKNKGDAGSTNSDANSADSASGDANPTCAQGDADSAIPGPSSGTPTAVADAARIPAPAPTAAENSGHAVCSQNIPPNLRKVPAIVKAPLMPPPPPPPETDAVASDTYKAIMAGRSVKNTLSTLRGTGRAKANTDCGSFFNTGDNRVSRSVCKENVAKMYVSSMSFNPVTWECSACPWKHSILGGGGGGGNEGGEGRTVILLTDQNFPAVLPTGSGNCLAIIRIDQGKLSELTDLLLSISPEQLPQGTIFVLGSLSQLQGEGLQGYAKAGVSAGRRLSGKFPDSYSFLFTPPPPHGRLRQPTAHQGHLGLL
jgi:hypothetical protein